MNNVIFAKDTPSELYNSLSDVERAELALKASGKFEKFLNEIGELIKKYNLLDKVGLTLVHIHNELKSDNLGMLRIIETDNGQALMKTIVTEKQNLENASPASLWVSKDSDGNFVFIPLEWSAEKKSKDAFQEFSKSDFSKLFAEKLFEYGLQDLIGITTKYTDEIISDKNKILVENTKETGKDFEENVVTETDPNKYNKDELVETNWFFGEDLQTVRCCRVCVQYRTFCVRYSPGHGRVRRCVATGHRRCAIG